MQNKERTQNAYVRAWSKTPDSQKYFATMDRSVEVINSIIESETVTPGVKKPSQQKS